MAGAGPNPSDQHDREQLKLPEPAATLWKRIRTTVHKVGTQPRNERINPGAQPRPQS